MSKKQNKFQILKSLERDSHPTQRQLSNDLGVSLGKTNYCLLPKAYFWIKHQYTIDIKQQHPISPMSYCNR